MIFNTGDRFYVGLKEILRKSVHSYRRKKGMLLTIFFRVMEVTMILGRTSCSRFSLLKSRARDYMPFVPHRHSLGKKEGKGMNSRRVAIGWMTH